MHHQLRTRPSPPSPRGEILLEPLLSFYSLAYSVSLSEFFPPFFLFVSSGPRHSEAKNNTWFVYRQPNITIRFIRPKKTDSARPVLLRRCFPNRLLGKTAARPDPAFLGPIYIRCTPLRAQECIKLFMINNLRMLLNV
jgi:hypothetical protein